MSSQEIDIACAGTQRPGKGKWHRSLAEERPDLAKQWVKDPNGDVTPESVSAGSAFLAAWQCGNSCEEIAASFAGGPMSGMPLSLLAA